MVQIGEIYIAGKEGDTCNRNVYNSGVAFYLSKKSPINGTYYFESGKWEIEIQKDNQKIVARSRDIFPEEKILQIGFDYCQKYLDLLSVAKKINLSFDIPDQEYILVFNQDSRIICRIVTNRDVEFSIFTKITDKYDNVIEVPPVPYIDWVPAFRFYRISQSGCDLYDAYRNLFLAFESLMSEITPKKKREREKDWLNRALKNIGNNIPLKTLVPLGEPPVQYITDNYCGLRNKTFHAKNQNYLLPYNQKEAEKLSIAYEGLLRTWREVASAYKNVPGGGGVFTIEGFVHWMDEVHNKGISMQITDDPSPEIGADIPISPLGNSVYLTNKNVYESNYRSGIVRFKGEFESPIKFKLESIHRFGLMSGDVQHHINYYEEGIKPQGIDKLELYRTFRMINKSSPKIIF